MTRTHPAPSKRNVENILGNSPSLGGDQDGYAPEEKQVCCNNSADSLGRAGRAHAMAGSVNHCGLGSHEVGLAVSL